MANAISAIVARLLPTNIDESILSYNTTLSISTFGKILLYAQTTVYIPDK
jgi:hypothetical protein